MEKKNPITDEMPVRFPGTLSLKDLITLVSVAVSLTIAWGVFGTRITLIEKELEAHKATNNKLETELSGVRTRIDLVEKHQYDSDVMIDRLYEGSKIPQPKRRVP